MKKIISFDFHHKPKLSIGVNLVGVSFHITAPEYDMDSSPRLSR